MNPYYVEPQPDYGFILVWVVIFYVMFVILFAAVASHKLSGEEAASKAFGRFFWCGLLASPAAIVIVYSVCAFLRDMRKD